MLTATPTADCLDLIEALACNPTGEYSDTETALIARLTVDPILAAQVVAHLAGRCAQHVRWMSEATNAPIGRVMASLRQDAAAELDNLPG